LNNIAPPTYGTTELIRKQGQFQENIDRAAAGFPKLPGMKTVAQVRAELENKQPKSETPTAAVPKVAPKRGDIQQHAGATYVFDGKQYVKQ
jgi:hypothetical protein